MTVDTEQIELYSFSMINAVRQAQPGDIVWDKGKGSIKGVHLKVTAKGKKVWMLYYRTRSGQQRRPKLGNFNEMGLPNVREIAKTLLQRVSLGEDPRMQWDKEKAEMIVDELFKATFEGHWSQERFKISGWARQAECNYHKHIEKVFGRMRLCEVSTMKVREWHESLRDTPIAANRALEVLSRMFNYAIEKEWRLQGTNPCRVVKAFTEKKRKRYAGTTEIQSISTILSRLYVQHPHEITFIYLLMYTGARPRAIERAKRAQIRISHVDGVLCGVLECAGKSSETTGDDEVIIFSPQAMGLLEKLPPAADGSLTGCKMPSRLWRKIRTEAGCEDLWARDWRRTFATFGLSHGVEPGVIGELQNHRTAQTRLIYQKLLPDARLSAVTTIAGKLEGLMNGTTQNQV